MVDLASRRSFTAATEVQFFFYNFLFKRLVLLCTILCCLFVCCIYMLPAWKELNTVYLAYSPPPLSSQQPCEGLLRWEIVTGPSYSVSFVTKQIFVSEFPQISSSAITNKPYWQICVSWFQVCIYATGSNWINSHSNLGNYFCQRSLPSANRALFSVPSPNYNA